MDSIILFFNTELGTQLNTLIVFIHFLAPICLFALAALIFYVFPDEKYSFIYAYYTLAGLFSLSIILFDPNNNFTKSLIDSKTPIGLNEGTCISIINDFNLAEYIKSKSEKEEISNKINSLPNHWKDLDIHQQYKDRLTDLDEKISNYKKKLEINKSYIVIDNHGRESLFLSDDGSKSQLKLNFSKESFLVKDCPEKLLKDREAFLKSLSKKD
tara:strand:- start:10954 stop:11592 length:639 start_codon:yes stop_codon:yes gene_type:complete